MSFDFFKNPEMKRFLVGFDEQMSRFAKFQEEVVSRLSANYPPFNVRKVDDNRYVIEIAVAGFAKQDLDVELQDNKLVVRGNVSAETPVEGDLLYQGIAARAFTRAFALSDKLEVKNAELLNGMLRISLERMVELTPAKKVDIETPAQ